MGGRKYDKRKKSKIGFGKWKQIRAFGVQKKIAMSGGIHYVRYLRLKAEK